MYLAVVEWQDFNLEGMGYLFAVFSAALLSSRPLLEMALVGWACPWLSERVLHPVLSPAARSFLLWLLPVSLLFGGLLPFICIASTTPEGSVVTQSLPRHSFRAGPPSSPPDLWTAQPSPHVFTALNLEINPSAFCAGSAQFACFRCIYTTPPYDL